MKRLDKISNVILVMDKLKYDAEVKGCGTSKRAFNESWKALVKLINKYKDE